jgi:hypothetical protein
MKGLIWKEFRENLKWVAVPSLVIGALVAFLGPPPLMNDSFLLVLSLIAAVFGAVLGFLQVSSESQGDKRSLLLHRPLVRSQIFLAKVLVGVGLYLVGIGVPFACAVALAATPGHIAEPFSWPMTLPWLADTLLGIVCYLAGMLTAQREARWYGSRCLGLAAGLFCWFLVWMLPEVWHAVLALAIAGGLIGLAAWGSFMDGGAYAPQPRLAKIALATTFLLGISALSVSIMVLICAGLWTKQAYYYRLSPQGQVLLVHEEGGRLQSITDLDGRVPEPLRGERLDLHALEEISAPFALGRWPKTISYRNSSRCLLKHGNESKPGSEEWWYVPDRGRLFGYDKLTKQPIGSFGPDGFVPPGEQASERFQGEPAHVSRAYFSVAKDYLAFPDAVYRIDFRKRTLRTLFVPADGEKVLWASRWTNEKEKQVLAFVGTNKSVHVLDETGSPALTAPLAFDLESYQIAQVGRLDNPLRYWIWYEPAWYLGLDVLETTPAYVVFYDRAGQEIGPRQEVPPKPGIARDIMPRTPPVEPSWTYVWFGLITPPAEAAVLIGTTQALVADVRKSQGAEMPNMLQWLMVTTQHIIPGVRWDPRTHSGIVFGYTATMLLSALLSALICLLLARRFAFSKSECIIWSLCGLIFGVAGLLLMLTLQEWPARIACPKCRKSRVVTRDICEHCGAAHAMPPADGTEIIEPVETTRQAVLVGG